MLSDPVKTPDRLSFGGNFELDLRSYQLLRSGKVVKLERIPTDLLVLLVENRGQLVSRDQIVERIWGKDVFLDTDSSINAAIRKIRQALKDVPEQPRFVQTITGRGYRFIAAVLDPNSDPTESIARETGTVRDSVSEKPTRKIGARGTNLPLQRTGFVGRESELAAAEELLLCPNVRLLTVSGAGGIGKTRFAIQLATGLAEHFSGGSYFVSLASLKDPGLIASAIIQTLGIREARGKSPLQMLKECLEYSARKPMLLLLDNFEHLLSGGPSIAELLAASPSLKIMVTSREALHVYGEHEFPIPRLAVPDARSSNSVEIISGYAAVALFVQRAVAAKPDFALDRENAADVSEICFHLDGLPLAIELAAARVKVLPPTSMQKRLGDRLQLLTGGACDLPKRQQTLRAAIDWSHDLLTPAEQKLFRRVSVFVGGCTLEAAEAVCDTRSDLGLDVFEAMASLVNKSLLQQIEQPSSSETRFLLLETIREYALEKLAASGERASTSRAHAAYCLVLAEEAAAGQSGEQAAQWLDRFVLEHDNFRAGLAWLIETGDAEWGLRLGAAMFPFWEVQEYLAEGRDWMGKLLNLERADPPTRTHARAFFASGALAAAQGDYASADALTGKSLEIMRQLGDKQGAAVYVNALAVIARDRGDFPAALSLFEESLFLWRELADQKAIARSINNLANILKLQGDIGRAALLYEECLSIFRQLGDQAGIAWSMNSQGDVARDQGDFSAARALYDRSLAIFRELGDLWGIAGTLADLGNLAREQKDFLSARSRYQESLKAFRAVEHKRGVARVLECFACLAANQLESARALRFAGAASALRQHLGAPLAPAEQEKLDAILKPAQQLLGEAASATAWLQGLEMLPEKAIEDALICDTISPLN